VLSSDHVGVCFGAPFGERLGAVPQTNHDQKDIIIQESTV
jgi:hypothetical protein